MPSRRSLLRLFAAIAILLCGRDARADTVAERVVARVDGHPILLSEIRARARPRLAQAAALGAIERVSATQKIYAEVLEERIEEEIVRALAATLQTSVSDEELDRAVGAVASSQGMTREELLRAAFMQGFSASDYRVELRGQLLRQKVLYAVANRDVRGVGPYPDDEAGQRAWLARVETGPFAEEKRRACVERLVRW